MNDKEVFEQQLQELNMYTYRRFLDPNNFLLGLDEYEVRQRYDIARDTLIYSKNYI